MVSSNDFILELNKYLSNSHFSEEDVVSLRQYYDIKYQILLNQPRNNGTVELILKIFLLLANHKIVTLDISTNNYKSINSKMTIHRDFTYNSRIRELFSYALKELLNIEELIEPLNSKLLEAINKQKTRFKKEFISNIKDIYQKIEETNLVKDQEKVTIYPYLTLIQGGKGYLSLKVGRSRLYSVNSIRNFIYQIYDNEMHYYGKELAFIHNINVFDKEGRKLISLLNDIAYYGGKEVIIEEEALDSFLNIYKGKIINISFPNLSRSLPEPYLISLENKNIKININKDYILSLEKNDSIYGHYYIDKENKRIDYIETDPVLIDLINLIDKSEYPCIEDDIDNFKYTFLVNNPDKFIIDPSIKEEFLLNSLDIKAYFDFDNGKIYLEEKMYLNDKEIIVDKLNKHLAAQYYKYRSIISNLGFIDNVLKDEALIISFLSSSLDSLKQYAEVYLSENILNKSISKFNPPNIRINYQSNMLDVFLEESRYSDEELFEILKGLRKKKKFILYKDQIITLDNFESEDFLSKVNDYELIGIDNKKENKLPTYYAFKALDDSHGISLNDQIINIFNEIKHFKDNPFSGGGINGSLRPYQLHGVKWLDVLYRYNLNGILADDMGLGKTIEIISFIKGENIEGNCLIVSPKSLIFNWMNEFMKFAPDMNYLPIYGSQKDRENIINKIPINKKCIYLTSYDSLLRDQNKYKDIEFDIMILDEAQYIKNSHAKKTNSVISLKSRHRFVLTGTPIENSILDLWSIFNFLMPKYLPNEDELKRRFESDNAYAQKIKSYVTPFILRRNKNDVLKDLPDKYEMIVSCQMDNEQRKIYDAEIMLAKETLANGGGAFDVFPYLMRLRQICISPSLFIKNYQGESGKLIELYELINNRINDGHKILLFSQFVSALDIIQNELSKKGINYLMITGKTDAKDRLAIVNEFNASNRIKICLISLKAGGTGLNLIGADVVIHLDPWWNIAAQNQATDRAHRIGQKKNVEVIKLIMEDSIEQRVVELQNIKKDLVDKIIAKDETSITSLSLEDLSFLLK